MKARKKVVPGTRASGAGRARDPFATPRRRPALGGVPASRPSGRPSRSTAAPTHSGSPPALTASRAGATAGDRASTVDLTIDLAPGRPGGLPLRNPILVASGTFGYGVEYGDVVDVQRLGAICCKGTTLKPRVGNLPPRVTETPAGMLNSIGLQNPGVDGVVEKYAGLWSTWQVPVIVNVAGESIEDYVAVARRLDGVPGIAGIELNISCPNVGKGGLQFAVDPDAAGAVTAAVRRATDLPLLVKLSPNVADVRGIARAIEAGGADAISAINTLSGIAMDREHRRPLLGNVYGGLSGPAIKPVGLRVVYEVAQTVRIPVVGIGGIAALEDVLDYLMAGASAVQVGTAIFADPTLPVRLIDELAAWCAANGLASFRELVGAALPAGPRGRGRGRDRPSAQGVEYRP